MHFLKYPFNFRGLWRLLLFGSASHWLAQTLIDIQEWWPGNASSLYGSLRVSFP